MGSPRHHRALTPEQFLAAIRGFTRSAFRFEAQPHYVLDYERPLFERWLAGTPVPPPEVDWWAPWLDRVARWTAEGKTVGRVRVLAEPPSAYQQWLLWATPWHAEVGEQLRYLPRTTAQRIGLPLAQDWWLLDDDRVITMQFNHQGEITSRTLITNPMVVADYRVMRDTAIDNSALAEAIPA